MATHRRLNKQMALKTIANIINEPAFSDNIPIDELCNLYLLVTSKTKDMNNIIHWQHQFVSKNVRIEALNYLFIPENKKYVCSSNGYIFTRSINTDELQHGYYDRNLNPIENNASMADIDYVLADNPFQDKYQVDIEFDEKYFDDVGTIGYTTKDMDNAYFNKEYIDKILSLKKLDKKFYKFDASQYSMLIVGNESLHCGVMPVRVRS